MSGESRNGGISPGGGIDYYVNLFGPLLGYRARALTKRAGHKEHCREPEGAYGALQGAWRAKRVNVQAIKPGFFWA